jgi:hypothetical protein
VIPAQVKAIVAIVVVAGAFAVGWGAAARGYRADIAELHALQVEQQAAAEREARAAEQVMADNARSAADAYSKNLRRARAAVAGARTELDGLRDAIAAVPACPAAQGASAPGGTDGTAGLRRVADECSVAFEALAGNAALDAAKVTGLQDYIRAIGAAPAPAKEQP